MSFVDGKFFSFDRKKFRRKVLCCICAKEFATGDICRWIYGAKFNPPFINVFVCDKCDDIDGIIIVKAREEFNLAVYLAKKWDIYGPDWGKNFRSVTFQESSIY